MFAHPLNKAPSPMRHLRLFSLPLLLVFVVGCGDDQGVVVDGSVTKNGSPLTPGDSEGVTITLTNGGTSFKANVGEGGKFSVQKPAGGGIPAGKYQVSYVHYQNSSPYSKTKPFRHEKKLTEEWDVSPTNHTFSLTVEGK